MSCPKRTPFFAILVAIVTAIASHSQSKPTNEPFRVEVSGNPQGPDVLLIPGLSSSGAVWKETVAHLGTKYHCHTFTLAGFAGVPRLGDGAMLPTIKTALVEYTKAKKLKQSIVIGHSLGGHMALWMAAENPKLFGKLVIVDSLPHLGAMMFPDPASLRKQAEGMKMMITSQSKEQYKNYVKSSNMLNSMVGDAHLAEVKEWSMESDPVAIGNAMFDLYTTDLREEIVKIESPTLVLNTWIAYKEMSTREQVVGNVTTQYAKLKNKTFYMSDTAKHFLMLDDAPWFFEKLDGFLRK